MGKYTREDILRLVREEDIQFIRMQFTDIFGQMKNVAITASQIEKALDNQIMMDGSSIEGFVRIEESDQYLWPDLDTFAILPWRPQYGKVARLICDVHNPDGTPFVGDPRGVLKRALARAGELGLTFNVGPELEFFLFQTDEDGNPTTKTSDEAGYFDLGPLDHGESTRREICLCLEEMGFEIEASHHEVAAGQHEIDFKYTEALQAADNIMTFKLAVKTLAQKNGLHATFMPKPVCGAAGSGIQAGIRQGIQICCTDLVGKQPPGLRAQLPDLCRLCQHRGGGRRPHFRQQAAAGAAGYQHPQIGHPLRHVRRRQPQIGPQCHPPQPGQGVPLGLGGLQQRLQRGGRTGGVVQPVPQALVPPVQGGEVRRRHGPQPGQDGPLTVVPEHRGPAGGLLGLIGPGHGRGQQGQGLLPFPLPQQRPEAGG